MELLAFRPQADHPTFENPSFDITQGRLRVGQPAARWKLVASRRDSFFSSLYTRRLRARLSHAAASRLFTSKCQSVVTPLKSSKAAKGGQTARALRGVGILRLALAAQPSVAKEATIE